MHSWSSVLIYLQYIKTVTLHQTTTQIFQKSFRDSTVQLVVSYVEMVQYFDLSQTACSTNFCEKQKAVKYWPTKQDCVRELSFNSQTYFPSGYYLLENSWRHPYGRLDFYWFIELWEVIRYFPCMWKGFIHIK